MTPLPFTLVPLWTALAFSAYYFLAKDQQLALRIWKTPARLHPNIKTVLVQRAWGFLFLGVLTLLLVMAWGEEASTFGLGFNFTAAPPWWSWPLLPLVILLSYLQASSRSNLEMYPQIRIRVWSTPTLVASAISWILFLLAYEFLFRGFLLFGSLQVMGPWQAIALNVALYSLAHMYKGPGETFGSIPVGIFLCFISLNSGNIWMAMLFHTVMALSNEWFSLRAHPHMQFGRK